MAASQDRRLARIKTANGGKVPAFVPKPRGKRPPNWRGAGGGYPLTARALRGEASQEQVAIQTRAIAKEQRRLAKLERTAAVERAGESRLRKAARRIRAFMRGGIQ